MSMTKIATVTVGAGGASSIDFTSIPQGFTDVMVMLSARLVDSSPLGLYITFNGSSSNFTSRGLEGSGTSASSWTRNNQIGGANGGTSNTFSSTAVYIPNYAGSTNKSFSAESTPEVNATANYITIEAALWSQTAAITSIGLTANTTNFVQYSTATLYGITKGSLAGVTVS